MIINICIEGVASLDNLEEVLTKMLNISKTVKENHSDTVINVEVKVG